jgi:hypothetical protein
VIIHIIPDSLYSDTGVEQFRRFSNDENRCIVVGAPRQLSFIKGKVEFVDPNSVARYINETGATAVIVHKLTDVVTRQIPRVAKRVIIVWIPWGQDYQALLFKNRAKEKNLLPLSFDYFARSSSQKNKESKTVIQRIKRAIGQKTGFYQWRTKRGLRRVNLFLSGIPQETNAIRAANPWFVPEIMHWGYPHAEIKLDASESVEFGRDIMLGNSGSITNNHADGFDFIQRYVEIENRRIVTPLSYGSVAYRDWVEMQGREIFPSQFEPIREVLPRDKYHSLMNSCGHAFFFHCRQEAVGNILVRLFRGARIYMLQRNPLYVWLRDSGAIVSSLEEIQEECQRSSERWRLNSLTQIEREINRNVVLNVWGQDLIDSSTRAVLNRISRG